MMYQLILIGILILKIIVILVKRLGYIFSGEANKAHFRNSHSDKNLVHIWI